MGLPSHQDPFTGALDTGAELSARTGAIEELGSSGSRAAAETLLTIGARTTESVQILRAAGTALGALAHSGVYLSEFDMRDIQGATYDAFCDYQASALPQTRQQWPPSGAAVRADNSETRAVMGRNK